MTDQDKALATQIVNIETKTGKRLGALVNEVLAQGLTKHSDMVSWAKQAFALGHGDANTLVHLARKPAASADADVLGEIYSGAKAGLRPIHDRLMASINGFGAFETAPKKGYVSLRRKKQFAMLGPKTNSRFELGLNLKDDISHPRMKAVPPGGMCQYVVSLEAPEQIDDALVAIIRKAFAAAG